jgi:hypothetical protein
MRLIAWNVATTDWYTNFANMEAHRRNMVWWQVTSLEARERLVEWEEDTRDIVARFRAYVAVRQGNPRVRDLVSDLRRASPEFARWWVEHDVQGQRVRPRRLHHPRLGTRTMRLQVMVPTETDTARVVFHVPVDEPDAPVRDENARARQDDTATITNLPASRTNDCVSSRLTGLPGRAIVPTWMASAT